MSSRKRPLPNGGGEVEGEDEGSARKKYAPQISKPLDAKKFGGKTEEEVCQMLLPDHMGPGLDIIFMGINPGLYSAYLGHHYCNANNHFWPCLFESGLIPKRLSFREDAELLNYGIGVTNIVPRTTRAANELSKKEIKDWSKVMIEKMQELKPLIICFNGKGIYEIFTGAKCTLGQQQDPLPGTDTVVYVMPSTSGRAATFPRRADKLKFFNELKDLKERLQIERAGRIAKTDSISSAPAEQVPDTSQTGFNAAQKTSDTSCRDTSQQQVCSVRPQQVRPQQVAVIVDAGSKGKSGSTPTKPIDKSSKTSDTDTSAITSPYFQSQ